MKTRAKSFEVERYKPTSKRPPALPAPTKPTKTNKKQERTLAKAAKMADATDKLITTFGLKRSAIQNAVESGDIDSAISTFQRTAYSTIISIIPIAEKEYRKGKRESQAYALNALLSSARELAQDLAAANDRAKLAETLLHELFEPMLKALVQRLLQDNMVLKSYLNDKIKPEHRMAVTQQLDTDIRALVAYLQTAYQATAEQMRLTIQGER